MEKIEIDHLREINQNIKKLTAVMCTQGKNEEEQFDIYFKSGLTNEEISEITSKSPNAIAIKRCRTNKTKKEEKTDDQY